MGTKEVNSGQFKKGQSGNPSGRPKGTLTEILKAHGENEKLKVDGKLVPWREAVSIKLWKMALKGDRGAIIEIFNRIDGKPKESIAMDLNANIESFINNFRSEKEKI